MKKAIIIISGLVLTCLLWLGFSLATLPPPPSMCGILSDNISLDFVIHKMNMNDIELSLDGKDKTTFIHFSRSKDWTKGRPGLVVNSMKKNSRFGNKGMKPDAYKRDAKGNKEFGQFMKDNRGKDVKKYNFTHQLTEGDDGQMYMKMAYSGPKMPLIQFLRLSQAVPVTEELSRYFMPEGNLVFQPGTYHLDKSINGFWIPVFVVK